MSARTQNITSACPPPPQTFAWQVVAPRSEKVAMQTKDTEDDSALYMGDKHERA